MKRVFVSFCMVLVLVFGGFLYTEALTETQIDSILNLLTSFGADGVTLSNVESALRGGTNSSSFQYTFTQNLSFGDRNEEVRNLQRALNSLVCCQIAAQGAGSPGQESTFYGSKTRDSVIRFQNTYRGDILTPAGLVTGNGFFGPRTRAKLNELLAQPGATGTESQATLAITGLSQSSGTRGETFTILGRGFTDLNDVHFGNGFFPDVVSTDGTSISFLVPTTLSPECAFTVPLPESCTTTLEIAESTTYPIRVSNENGTSNTFNFTIIETPGVPGTPRIDAIAPKSGPVGTTITITGSGFSQTDNTVLSTFFNYEDVSSDGTTITVTVTVPENIRELFDTPTGSRVIGFPNIFSVSNQNGISNPIIFNLVTD
ncbi:hypothetical protein CL654_01000 [bacterium]|nr:hypothetical protein [bacterium]|tara:strand:+ start:3398 stop:4516 length:1119 start_codon:yes stop_codon:yes gene_type:complete